jgi:hypothetical protein
MPLPYYHRLNSSQKRIYRQSDAIGSIPLRRAADLRPLATQLEKALAGEHRSQIERICQRLADGLTQRLGVTPVQIVVHTVRPSDRRGELQGLYEPVQAPYRARISLWMRTAQREQVVAYRTFLRTLLHELCHHLDYELLHLADSLHTEGFYKRESSLFRQLVAS